MEVKKTQEEKKECEVADGETSRYGHVRGVFFFIFFLVHMFGPRKKECVNLQMEQCLAKVVFVANI